MVRKGDPPVGVQKPPDYVAGWGELIRAHRIYIGVSQRCLAERLKMREGSLVDIEVGRRLCPPGFLDAVEEQVEKFDQDVRMTIDAAKAGHSDDEDGSEWTAIEVTDDEKGEWSRAVIGRAAVESSLVMPVRRLDKHQR